MRNYRQEGSKEDRQLLEYLEERLVDVQNGLYDNYTDRNKHIATLERQIKTLKAKLS
jgi:hypothetical protein